MIILVFLFGILFVITLQPVFIVRRLIIITFIYSFFIFNGVGSYWFRYLLLIVILRGVLVVFTYMVTLIPNERFEIYQLMLAFLLILMFIVKWDFFYGFEMSFLTLNLWNRYIGVFNLFLVRFLLVVILLVVLLRGINYGSFRVK